MYSSAAEFLTNQVVPTTFWNIAETGIQYTQQLFGHYLSSATCAILGRMIKEILWNLGRAIMRLPSKKSRPYKIPTRIE